MDAIGILDKFMDLINEIFEDINHVGRIETGKVSDLINEIVCYSEGAEKTGNVEAIKLLAEHIIPRFNDVDNLFQEMCSILSQESTFNVLEIKEELEDIRNGILASENDYYVHFNSDTIENTGDFILVRCVRRIFEQHVWKIDSEKWIPISVRRKVNQNILNIINESEATVVGGGGLFIRDTNKNDISGWQWPISISDINDITKPLVIFAVGYNRFRGQEEFDNMFAENLSAVVRKSSFFGLRNKGSIRAVREYLDEELKEKVVYQPCPTTLISRLYDMPSNIRRSNIIAVNCAFDRPENRFDGKEDVIFLAMSRVLGALSGEYRIKIYIHHESDNRICKYLDAECVDYERVNLMRELSEYEILTYYSEPELFISMRGHGQMIPFGCGTPTLSVISHDKLKWFLEDIGHSEWGLEILDEDFEEKLYNMSIDMIKNHDRI